jgi:hypothetical protein
MENAPDGPKYYAIPDYYYNLEILCLIAWVITLIALLPFFAFINNEFAGNLSYRP